MATSDDLLQGATDMKLSKYRAGTETGIALFAGGLGLLTVSWHDWIEGLTGWDPDRHNGGLEWLIVVVLLAAAVTMGLVAHRDWRQLAAARK
jgi:hypothetical protein